MRRFTSCLILIAVLAGCDSATEPADLTRSTASSPSTDRAADGRARVVNGRIAFHREDPVTGGVHVFIADPDGEETHQLRLPFDAAVPVWSPDGRRLLVTVLVPNGLPRPAIVNPDGSNFRMLEIRGAPSGADIYCRAWSPGGTRLLCQFVSFSGENAADGIYAVRASDGGGLTRLTNNPFPPRGNFGGGDNPGSFSPDGSQFVFMRAKPGPGPVPDQGQTGALFVKNTNGTGLHRITPYGLPNSHDEGVAHWSPNGKKILFASDDGALYTVRPDGAGLRKIPLHPGGAFFVLAPDWSPDGEKIVFSMFLQSRGRFDIYTTNADGTGIAPLTHTPAFEDFPDWAPRPVRAHTDGRQQLEPPERVESQEDEIR